MKNAARVWFALAVVAATLTLWVAAVVEPLVGRMTLASPAAIAGALLAFVGLWLGLALAQRLCHDRRLRDIVAPRRSRHDSPHGATGFGAGLALGLGLFAASMALALALGLTPRRSGLDPGTWALWLGPLAVLIAIQASGEEALFRGYLLQRLGRVSTNPLLWAVLPSVAFGALHFDPSLPLSAGLLYVVTTALFGMAAAVTVARTGAVVFAMGLHTGINLPSLTGSALAGPLSGAALYVWPEGEATALLAIDLAVTALLLLGILRAGPAR